MSDLPSVSASDSGQVIVEKMDLDLPAPPVSKKQKLGGYDFYRSIGSPRYVVAPMVDQSELVSCLFTRVFKAVRL